MKNTKNKKPIFDTQIVSNACTTYAVYKVTYYLYADAGKARRPHRPLDPIKEFAAFKLSGSCFSGLLRTTSLPSNNKKYNRVCYTLEWPKEGSYSYTELSTEERKSWVKLCKTYKLLPSYVTPATAEDGVLVLKLTDTLSPSLLYCYLSAFRCLREQTGFVKAMLYLVKEKGMNFYAAFVLASSVTVCSSGTIHHIGEWGRPYMKDVHVDTILVFARSIVSLKRFLQNPSGIDTRTIWNARDGWLCRRYILDALKPSDKITGQKEFTAAELLNEDVIKKLGV